MKPLLIEGATTMLVATAGSGKTFLLLLLAMALASGRTVFGSLPVTRSYRVAYLDEELSGIELRKRLLAVGAGLGLTTTEISKLPLFLYHAAAFTFDDDVPHLEQEVALNQVEFVFFDPFIRMFKGDENDARITSDVFKKLAGLKKRGVGIVLAHHTMKHNKSRGRGSSDIRANLDAEFTLTGSLHEGRVWIEQAKARQTGPCEKFAVNVGIDPAGSSASFLLERQAGRAAMAAQPTGKAAAMASLDRALQEGREMRRADLLARIQQDAKVAKSTAKAALSAVVAAGKAHSRKEGKTTTICPGPAAVPGEGS